jgi:hypothetical protein
MSHSRGDRIHPYAGRSELGRPGPGQGFHFPLGRGVDRALAHREPGHPTTFTDPARAAEVAEHAERWCDYLAAGLRRMHADGPLQPESDPDRLAMSAFASLQGGLLMMQAKGAIDPLAAALDGALAALHSFAVAPGR